MKKIEITIAKLRLGLLRNSARAVIVIRNLNLPAQAVDERCNRDVKSLVC
jgi:hypothetical protein